MSKNTEIWHLSCIKLDFFCFIIFKEYICKCMKFDFLLFCYFWRMHIWMHEIWFYFVLLFLKNAYMNEWNLIFFCFVIFEECMKLWFYYFWRMHIWVHKIQFSFEECMLKCMNFFFYFLFFWMKMHEILFWIFLDDNAWNSIFFNDHFQC